MKVIGVRARWHCGLAFTAILLLLPTAIWAWAGKCVGVTDGDTIQVMHEGRAEKIRLYGVDCPEGGQDFGAQAKGFTSDMVFGRVVEVQPLPTKQPVRTEQPVTTDQYGRTVAWVTVEGKSLNKELVKAGMAWWFKKYAPNDTEIDQLEREARATKIGLWSHANPIPPWEYRSPNRKIPPGEPVVYHGNLKSRRFHAPNCRDYDCSNCVAQFASREAALSEGYRPCNKCRP